jgi:Lar family restriction alleviation protein
MEKLLPCPFCGGEAEIDFDFSGYNESTRYYGVCNSCYAKSHKKLTKEEAIKAWNKRA